MPSKLGFIVLLISSIFQSRGPGPEEIERMRQQAQEAAEKHRQTAIRLNELAGRIRTEEDARQLVEGVAEVFADALPPPWATSDVRARVAGAEFRAATDPSQLIPEERVATIWNAYVKEIGAAEETVVNASENHALRDLKYATSKMIWTRAWNQTVWTMPNIYAVGNDGKVAKGCRPLEALA